MQKSETWALDTERIAAFFREQPDVTVSGQSFVYRDCRILLTSLPHRQIGSIHFPQTRIAFEGNAEDVSHIYRRFFLRFVSAGG